MILNCYKFEFSENFVGFHRFGMQKLLKGNEDKLVLSATALQPTEYNFHHYVSCICRIFARGLHTRTAVARLP